MVPAWPLLLATGPIAGSFLGVVTARFNAPRTILWSRSRCPHCSAILGAGDLIPLASWLLLGGRCRYCDVAISPSYLLIELAALVIAACSIALTTGWIAWITAGLGWALLALAVIDWQNFVLPDFLTIPLIPAGFAVVWVSDPSDLANHIVGACIGFALVVLVRQIYWQVRRREGIGLGDAKLLAAAGSWVGWQWLPAVVLIAALLGLACAAFLFGNPTRDERVPFGAFLALSTWLLWLYGLQI